jgi:hypothetical protein
MRKKLANQTGSTTGWVSDAQSLLVTLRNRKQTAKVVAETISEVQPKLIQLMQDHDMPKLQAIDAEGIKITGTKVELSVVEIDENRLASALGAAMWAKVTARKLDKKKLEGMIAAGQIDANVVASCSMEVDRAPYVLVKESKGRR